MECKIEKIVDASDIIQVEKNSQENNNGISQQIDCKKLCVSILVFLLISLIHQVDRFMSNTLCINFKVFL